MDGLEGKLLFRLIKVLYVGSLLLISLFFIMIGWENRPQPDVNDEESYIACDNGKNYNLQKNSFYVFSINTTALSSYDDEEARKLCQYGILNDYSTKYRNLSTPTNINYKLNIVQGTRGSWTSTLLYWGLGMLGSYVVLNLIRETLNYIFFGKKFDWLWLLIPVSYFFA